MVGVGLEHSAKVGDCDQALGVVVAHRGSFPCVIPLMLSHLSPFDHNRLWILKYPLLSFKGNTAKGCPFVVIH